MDSTVKPWNYGSLSILDYLSFRGLSEIPDRSSCRIGDPAMDAAFPLVIFNAATGHIIPSFDPAMKKSRDCLDTAP